MATFVSTSGGFRGLGGVSWQRSPPAYKNAVRDYNSRKGAFFGSPSVEEVSEPWFEAVFSTLDSSKKQHEMKALVAIFRPAFIHIAYGETRFGRIEDPSWIVDVEVRSWETGESLMHNERRVATRKEAIDRAAAARAWLTRPDSVAKMQAIPGYGPLYIKKTDFLGRLRVFEVN